MTRLQRRLRPFAARSRLTIVAIIITFALAFTASAVISIWSTSRSQHRATVVDIAARQRALAERYVGQVLLERSGVRTNAVQTANLMRASATALLDGGVAPAVPGDDDDVQLDGEKSPAIRGQLQEQQKLIADLAATGSAYLAGRPVDGIHLTGGEKIATVSAVQRLRILSGLTSSVSLDVTRSIAAQTDQNISESVTLQVALGAGGVLVSMLLAWALVTTTRRQTAHFRSLVTSSTDLVLVLSDSGCRYASTSVERVTGRTQTELGGTRYLEVVHEDDRAALLAAAKTGEVRRLVFRLRNAAGDWRYLEANFTDLRNDRTVRGVVVNSRDVTERIRLEQELQQQAQRDSFGAQLVEAFEMADEESAAYDVVRRAMSEISGTAPMELLLSDSSRAHLEAAAVHPTTGAPSCPVESPYSCVAVRRGNPVVFESSEALNACPKLRGRAEGSCSAVCVPVSFMGRSLGVLHATGPDNEPPSAEQVARLSTLAAQAGARIGTVRAFERTQLQAKTDGLTGLSNRRTVETELRRLHREGRPFALALADLDHFKRLNDKHGHEEGDRSLRLFAKVVRELLREEDLVARWGGEEFLIALPDADAEGAVKVMERIRSELAQALSGGDVQFTVSFGVADSTQAEGLQDLVRLADVGLYRSKHSGRDRVTVADPIEVQQALAAAGNGRRPAPALHQVVAEDDPSPI